MEAPNERPLKPTEVVDLAAPYVQVSGITRELVEHAEPIEGMICLAEDIVNQRALLPSKVIDEIRRIVEMAGQSADLPTTLDSYIQRS